MLARTTSHRHTNMGRERGATLVESMLSSVVLLFLSGFLIDVAFGLQRYGELSEGIARMTRRAASAPCSALLPEERREDSDELYSLAHQIRGEVRRVTGSSSNLQNIRILDSGFECDRTSFSPPLENHSHPLLATEVRVQFPCIFCLFVGGLELNLSTKAPIEDTSALCGYPLGC